MNYKIVEKDSIKIIAKIKIFKEINASEKIQDFWEEYFESQADEIVYPDLGICWPKEKDAKEFVYGIGTFRELVGGIPSGYMETTIEKGTWLIINVTGPIPASFHQVYKELETLKLDGYELTRGFEIEYYEKGNSDNDDYRSQLWLPLKRTN